MKRRINSSFLSHLLSSGFQVKLALTIVLLLSFSLAVIHLRTAVDRGTPQYWHSCDHSSEGEEPEDMEEWQKSRYLSEKFQFQVENPQAKCKGETGMQIHYKLQSEIARLQHPETCNGRFLIWKLGFGGFGQEMRKLAYQLAIAIAENRTLVLDTTEPWKYTDKEICPQQDLFCYFRPITSCTLEDIKQAHPGDYPQWAEDTLDSPVVRGHYNTDKWRYFTPPSYGTTLSIEWFRSELLHYVMRPNEFTEGLVKEEKIKLGLDPNRHSFPFIAIHVRGGDKHTEFKLHPFQEYLNKAKWFKMLYGVQNIFLVSDDADVILQAKQEKGFNIIWTNGNRATGGSQESTEIGHAAMEKVLKDILIASEMQFWIGTLSSNFGDIIWELMMAKSHGTIPPYVSLDIPWTTHNQPNVFI